MWLGLSNKTECPHQGTAWDTHAGMGTDTSVVLKASSTYIPEAYLLLTATHTGEVGQRSPGDLVQPSSLLCSSTTTEQGDAQPGKLKAVSCPSLTNLVSRHHMGEREKWQ